MRWVSENCPNNSLLQPHPSCGFKMGTPSLALQPREYVTADNRIAGKYPSREGAAIQCGV